MFVSYPPECNSTTGQRRPEIPYISSNLRSKTPENVRLSDPAAPPHAGETHKACAIAADSRLKYKSVSSSTPKRILIADDEPAGREFVRTVLESAGYEVLEARDGEEALAKASASSPDLILLDIFMPSRDGLSVVTELRHDPRFARTPIIAVTATAMKGDQEKGLEAGFTEYLTKPVSILTLRQTAARFLGNPEHVHTAT